ncbi:lipocalin/fatty acid-binding family protein [Limosilactobacillus caviae]|uniref:DUF3642 domain-containing protein n=1 Tax=Limosilactobacillus caviae TaxID=1769424 RepID=A0ABQ2C915_9LACO|nr:lipocalin/fatty acid-binding family protein [Limosilactobacillus caviae]GGI64208.1 hypothetical protein GCM10011459_20420 [Limosilactobacillus caviae]
MKKHIKNEKSHHVGLILFLVILIGLLCVFGFNYRQFASKQLNPVQTSVVRKTSSSSEESPQIIGSFRDDKDGAAIVFNENGTGRYVYADKENPNTDDALTWRKQGNKYLITLKDKDVTSPLTGTLDDDKLIVSGTGDWNTEEFQRTDKNLNLDKFLNEMSKK